MKKFNNIIIVSFTIFFSVSPILSFCEEKKESTGGVGAGANLPKDSMDPHYLEKKNSEEKKREEQINQVRLSYDEKKTSLLGAKQQLYPLVKEELKDYLANLDYQIQVLEKKLQFLKKGKQNPAYLIEERIREILGEVSPQEMNYW